MELRQLETFVRVVELSSFTRAGEELSLTQPAVTRQIAALEQELHTRLLERMGRRIDLTAAGETLLEYAREILRLSREAKQALSDVTAGVAGKLSVGASSTAATYVLPPLLKQFRESHENVELSVQTGVSSRIVELVMNNRVDLGIVMNFRERPGIIEVPLADYSTVTVVYPGHPLLKGKEIHRVIETSELSGAPLILMEEGTNLRTYVDRLLSEAGVEEQVTLELDNVESIKKMIEARLGISLLPLIALETEIESGRLIALRIADVPGTKRRISAIYREDKYLSSAMRAFLKLLKNQINTVPSMSQEGTV